MGKSTKDLKARVKQVSHTEKGRKPRRESALDKCVPVREVDRDSIDFLTEVEGTAQEAINRVADELSLLEAAVTSDDYWNIVTMTAPDEDTTEAIIKNCRTRLNEFRNFAQYVARIRGKFAHADITGSEE